MPILRDDRHWTPHSVTFCEVKTGGVYHIEHRGVQVLWVPRSERALKSRLMMCTHMQDAAYRGIRATCIGFAHPVRGQNGGFLMEFVL